MNSSSSALIPWKPAVDTATNNNNNEGLYEFQAEDRPWLEAIDNLGRMEGSADDDGGMIQNTVELPAPIHEFLYIGDYRCVQNGSHLQALGITKVVNMAGQGASPISVEESYTRHGIEYLEIEAQDDDEYPLLELHWQEVCSFLHDADKNDNDDGANISGSQKDGIGSSKRSIAVVHCGAGLNRSGLIACADYMITKQKSLVTTVKHVRQQRGTNAALCNEGFQEQLVAFARHHNLLGPIPTTSPPAV